MRDREENLKRGSKELRDREEQERKRQRDKRSLSDQEKKVRMKEEDGQRQRREWENATREWDLCPCVASVPLVMGTALSRMYCRAQVHAAIPHFFATCGAA